MKQLYIALWNLSEATGIGLGPFAPFVFAKCIGFKARKEQ